MPMHLHYIVWDIIHVTVQNFEAWKEFILLLDTQQDHQNFTAGVLEQ